MWRDARSPRQALRAARDLLLLELRVLTGNRLAVIAVIEILWLAIFAIWQRFRDEPWEPASFYNRTIVVPGLLPAIALGMSSVMGERDIRHLEMTFASPAGRYLAWSFRFGALAAACLACCAGNALLTWLAVDQAVPPLAAALHAAVPVLFVGMATVFFSIAFNGGASAALVAAVLTLGSAMLLHHPSAARWDLFLNPFEPPPQLDSLAWFRVLVFNRCLLLTATGLFTWGSLALLQRRERLT